MSESLLRYIKHQPNEWLADPVDLLGAMGCDAADPPVAALWAVHLLTLAQWHPIEVRAPLGGIHGMSPIEGPDGLLMVPRLALSAWIQAMRRELDIHTCQIKRRGPCIGSKTPVVRVRGEWVSVADAVREMEAMR